MKEHDAAATTQRAHTAPYPDEDGTSDAIPIAITFDTTYAMPAAVTIRSAMKHTRSKLSFFIVDLGLTKADKEKLQTLVENEPHADLQFVHLPDTAVASQGPVWAKVAMLDVLAPKLDRLLYLDADLLVRDDLRKLWGTDLGGNCLGAVLDIGIPMGHAGIERGPFLNAGVLLMDLAKMRPRLDGLMNAARSRKHSLQQDEDALNDHFRHEWLSLSLRWNAQGLGTYAEWPSEDRKTLNLAELADPGIVHFMGPVNPTMEAVLDRHRQPFPAKPWGYAGAPGHPYVHEWWAVIDETPWKGWRTSQEYAEYCKTKQEAAMKTGIEAFQRRIASSRSY
ncbi:hypothetical protein EIP86_010339 [Pleurotus ostreatoroseus]|nr:hypothetical protein EIP86_010339 [Pleurotus ostreatoroseus]